MDNTEQEQKGQNEFKVHRDFNEIFETAGLIYLCYHPKARSEEGLVDDSDSLSDRKPIYKKFQPFFDRYVDVFKENFISSDNDAFFFDEFNETLNIATMAAKNSQWLTNVETLNEEDIYQDILKYMFPPDKVIESMDDVIAHLEDGTHSFQTCWKFILALKKPKEYIPMYVEIIKNNLPAYQLARAAVHTEIEPLLTRFEKPPLEFLERFIVEDIYEFYPTLFSPFLLSLTSRCPVFCGLYLNERVEREQRKDKPRDILARMFKMLADQNKIEILCMLKEESMYNLQISKRLGISAATTHHHMTSLASQGFVSSEKRDGKQYYSLEKEQIREAIADLEAVFL